MNKILYYLLSFVGLLSFEYVDGQWIIEKCPTTQNLNAVWLLNGKSGWIAGDKGTMLYKQGSEWKISDTPTEENLYSLAFINDSNGWAVGAEGVIIHFDGSKWSRFESPTGKDLYSVSFKDSNNGVAVGASGTILVYEQGVWKINEYKVRGNLYSISMKEHETWIGGGLECVNFPLTQMEIHKDGLVPVNYFNSDAIISCITFTDSGTGWAAGSPSTLLYFNGEEWKSPYTGFTFPSLKSACFQGDNNGIFVGYDGTILSVSNNVWEKTTIPVSKNLNGVDAKDSTYCIVGDHGTIISRVGSGESKSGSRPDIVHMMLKVYPNPCDDFINVSIPRGFENAIFSISISNSAGAKIFEKELYTDDLPYPVATKELKNGLYLIKVKTGGIFLTSKFVVNH